jgi:hypothetical protein
LIWNAGQPDLLQLSSAHSGGSCSALGCYVLLLLALGALRLSA